MINSARSLAVGLLLATAWTASAACPPDCPVGGHRIKLGARHTATDQRVTVQTEKEATAAFPLNNSADDPVLHGATLRVFTETGDQFDETYQLPKDNWNYTGNIGQNSGYVYRDLTSLHGPIKLALIRPGNGWKAKGGGALGLSLTSNPNPVQVVLTFATTQVCMSFGGLARYNPGVAFKSVRAAAPADCPSPSPAFLDE
jgi:hypothetical protein